MESRCLPSFCVCAKRAALSSKLLDSHQKNILSDEVQTLHGGTQKVIKVDLLCKVWLWLAVVAFLWEKKKKISRVVAESNQNWIMSHGEGFCLPAPTSQHHCLHFKLIFRVWRLRKQWTATKLFVDYSALDIFFAGRSLKVKRRLMSWRSFEVNIGASCRDLCNLHSKNISIGGSSHGRSRFAAWENVALGLA